MAVIGARPARGFGLLGPRITSRTRSVARGGRRRASSRRARRSLGLPAMLAGIAAAACLALFYVSQSTHVAATGYVVDELEARLAEVEARQQQLLLEISEARSPATIERQARERLDLAPIDRSRITFATPSTEPAE
jgi:hypothetical protein